MPLLFRRVPGFRLVAVVWLALLALLACLAGCGAGPVASKGPSAVATPGPSAGSQPMAAAPSATQAREDQGVLPIAVDDPVRGDRLAYVTIVVFSDFQCPFCGKLAATFDRIAEAYGRDVRFVFKHEPLSFHQHAQLAAEVGHGVFTLAGSDGFWRYHDIAFRRQELIGPDAIRAWAAAAGADPREIEQGLARKAWTAKVDRDQALAKRLGATGTPSSFVNGVLVGGAQPFEAWKEVIDVELAKARALAERGVSRDRVYARMAASNYKEPTPEPPDDDEDEEEAPDTFVYKVPVGSSPVRGGGAALVTIVEFSDFQCPFCKRVQPALEQLRKEYGDKVRFVWKDQPLPFHPRAVPAAMLARSARAQKGDAGFWAAHDKLFESQPRLEDADLADVGRALGLDAAKVRAAIAGKTYGKAIDADVALADDVQATGTPHFFINGRRLVGAQPYEKFKAVVDAELAKAEALVRGGVAKTALYEAIIKDGKTAPEPERKVVGASASPAPFRGAANAKVVIQEFSDFQCPFCGRVEATIDELLAAYPGKIKVVWRDMPLPFHPHAQLAAEAAREAFAQKGNDGFSKMRVLLFANQKDPDGLTRAALDGYAAKIGLDVAKFAAALDEHKHQAAVDASKKAANEAGISGTPAFTVGPYFLGGAQPLRKFKQLVDRALAEPK